MSVTDNVQIVQQAYGNPGSLGEPLGLWLGEAQLTGDATGGFVALAFEPQLPPRTPIDARRQFVYFTDGVDLQVLAPEDAGNVSCEYFAHWARANAALNFRFHPRMASRLTLVNGVWSPATPLYEEFIHRFPQFWDTHELGDSPLHALVNFRVENNINLRVYDFRAYGRYYDKQILGNRGFGRLIAPAAISQF